MVMAILAVSIVAPSTASAQDKSPHRVGVVDVAYIFKNHAGIKAQVQKVEGNLKAFKEAIAAKQQALKDNVAKLKTFRSGTPEYAAQEESIAGMESKLRLEMARKQKDLADAEAKIYFENYQRIAQAVETIAKYNAINLVLRYNSEDMDLAKGESVIRGVMKNVVYHDPSVDLTPLVMQLLDKSVPVASRAAGPVRK
ncbi:MAG: OmpH family outer membrane protein [Planctomycetota bacterium]